MIAAHHTPIPTDLPGRMPMNRTEVEQLAALAKNGDTEAFLSLVEAWKGSMYRTARTILGSDADCADALQETILKAYGAVGKLKNPAFFKTWLYRILINECNTIRRKQARISLPGVMPEPALEDNDYRMVELKEALNRLKEPLRLAVALLLTGSALAGLSMLSPTFAQTLQRFSMLGTIYSDKGIEAAERKGLIQSYPPNLEAKDVPFGVRGIIYDGTRLVFDVYSKKSKADQVLYNAREVKKLSLFYKGQELSIGYSPVSDDTNAVTFEQIEENHLPDKFKLTLGIQARANEKPYELEIPVELNTSNIVIEKPQMPEELKKYGISVDKIILTPITMQVVYRAPFTLEVSEVYLNSMIDERGVKNFTVGGHADPLPGNAGLLTSSRFEPIREGDHKVTLRFDVITKDSKLLRQIDMTVPIPAAAPSSPSSPSESE